MAFFVNTNIQNKCIRPRLRKFYPLFPGDGDKHQKLMPPSKGKAKNERGKSALAAKGNKGGKGKEKVEESNEAHGEEEAPPPPPPLSIKLDVKLERLTCTKDVLEPESKS